ncbi:MAG: hypothetical protein F4139_10015 [Gemmatimonadetes bacterium]|nr:hypothetical protein [Gammaproteobacteria bacterium]MXY65069.1 hypothetical protein [Gammaproteobacteria bacterium]MYG65213.1 hypothetical protein [Gammaproteobacteria bacterium]MYH53270.1 hypothetical protein [Gemmatimonadota bacterium]
MDPLQAGVDCAVIALWLGDEGMEATQVCVGATLAMKEEALAGTSPHGGKPGDKLLDFLDSL